MLRLVITLALMLTLPHTVQAAERIALIITNEAYGSTVGRLSMTHADGQIMTQGLERLDFKVTHERDLDQNGMRKAFANHILRVTRAGPDAISLIYYSGHGGAVRADGDSFLIPVRSGLETMAQLPLLGIKLGDIVESLAETSAKAHLVLIDACRNTALTRATRTTFRGMTSVNARTGMLIAFSTTPGGVAVDGNYFSRAVAQELQHPGRDIVQALRAARRAVLRDTNDAQLPEVRELLVDDLCLAGGCEEAPAPGAPVPLAQMPRLAFVRCDGDDKALQSCLKEVGCYTGEIDGLVGPGTRKAVSTFQALINATGGERLSSEGARALERIVAGMRAENNVQDSARNDGGWRRDPFSGCRFWDPYIAAKEFATWNGACDNGIAMGRGEITWFGSCRPLAYWTVPLDKGIASGAGREYNGARKLGFEGQFINGGASSGIWHQGSARITGQRDKDYKFAGRVTVDIKGNRYEGVADDNGEIEIRGYDIDGIKYTAMVNSSGVYPVWPEAYDENIITGVRTPSGKGTAEFRIPDKLAESDRRLVFLIMTSESMKDSERQYWFNLWEVMNAEQREKLDDILTRERNKLAAIDRKYRRSR